MKNANKQLQTRQEDSHRFSKKNNFGLIIVLIALVGV